MMKAPFQGFPPELLAQIAQAAFRPPQGGMGGAPGLQAPQRAMGGGGMGGLGAGLGALGASFAGMGGGGGAPGAGAMPGEDRAAAPQWPPPMGDATTTVQPSSGGLYSWLGRNFGWGGSGTPAAGST
jgi:hypothetical protein